MFALMLMVACSDVTLRPLPGDEVTAAPDLWPEVDGMLGTEMRGAEGIVGGMEVPCVVADLTLYGEGVEAEGTWAEGALDVRLEWAEGDLDECPGMRYTGPPVLEFTWVADTWFLDLTNVVVGGPEEAIMPVTLIQPENMDMEVTTAVTYGQPGWNARIDLVNLDGTEWGPGYKVVGEATYWR